VKTLDEFAKSSLSKVKLAVQGHYSSQSPKEIKQEELLNYLMYCQRLEKVSPLVEKLNLPMRPLIITLIGNMTMTRLKTNVDKYLFLLY
jgi:hypothetical protein